MKTARIYKKEDGIVRHKQIQYKEIIYKETYIILKGINENHIIKNFENIICEYDDFSDLEKV